MMGHIRTKGKIVSPHPRKQTWKDLIRADLVLIFSPLESDIFVLSIHFPNVVEKHLKIKVSVITHEIQKARFILT